MVERVQTQLQQPKNNIFKLKSIDKNFNLSHKNLVSIPTLEKVTGNPKEARECYSLVIFSRNMCKLN